MTPHFNLLADIRSFLKVDPKHLGRRYVMGLVIIAIVVVASNLSAVFTLNKAHDDASHIYKSAQQSTLSERVLFLSDLYHSAPSYGHRVNLETAIITFEDRHKTLADVARREAVLARAFGFGLEDGLNRNAQRFVASGRQILNGSRSQRETALQELVMLEKAGFASQLDRATLSFESLASVRAERTRLVHYALILIALISLVFVAFVIFQPAQRVTNRALKALEDEIETRERAVSRLTTFADNVADLFWEADTTGIITYAGGSFLKLAGMKAEDMVGQHYLKVIHVPKRERAEMNKAIANLKGYSNIHTKLHAESGEVFTLELRAQPRFDQKGKICGYTGIARDVTEKMKTEAEIKKLAERDTLTNLINRRAFMPMLEKNIKEANPDQPLALFNLDIDGFKLINDTYGHETGDAVLREVANRLRDSIRSNDWAARLGGDEFVVVSNKVASPRRAQEIANRLIKAVEAPVEVAGRQLAIGVSVGIALSPTHSEEPSELMTYAEISLNHAKENGRGQSQLYSHEINADRKAQKDIERRFRQALVDETLTVHFQPIADPITGRWLAAEALARWHDREFGNIPPSVFVPIAERCGLVSMFGEQIMRLACKAATQWPIQDPNHPPRLAVNISPSQFRGGALPQTVSTILAETGLAAERLELEVTEDMILEDVEQAIASLSALKALGVSVAIDDFGAGHSSLARLRQLPIDRLKIDRSIIQDIALDKDSAMIANTIIQLGQNLGLSVVAEGIETERQLHMLAQAGCPEVQGFFLGKPMSQENLVTQMLSGTNRLVEVKRRSA